ncbi:hypothetical protein VNI00_017815 [Paramarasmius palmivorus]|uniref:DUF4470 domain-containing protein n=1 Tax=Paramarasmius palmivorus TaxID=297713 RepID=A0AAW0B5J0_9AGAR
MPAAEELKNEGNVAFKSGNFTRAGQLYAQAEQLEPSNAFYPSNLSAALFEEGKYLQSMRAISRARSKITDHDIKEKLAPKLSIRLAKCLAFGVREGAISFDDMEDEKDLIGDYQQYSSSADSVGTIGECKRAWNAWTRVEKDAERVRVGIRDARSRLRSIPLRKKPACATLEYFAIGHDEIMSVLHDWGPHEDDRQKLKLDVSKMSENQLARLRFFFAGIGDSRHALGSIIGIGQTYKTLSKDQQKSFGVHLTLNDINATILARGLCLFLLLDELASAQGDQEKEAELKMTLLCTWLGFIMPEYCFVRLRSTIMSLKVRLQADPPQLPEWLYVVPSSIPSILKSLDYWLSDWKHWTASHLLQILNKQTAHHPSKANFDDLGLPEPYRAKIEDSRRAEEEQFRNMVASISEEQLIKQTSQLKGFPECPGLDKPMERQAWMEATRDIMCELVLGRGNNKSGKTARRAQDKMGPERDSFEEVPTFIPPSTLRRRHEALDKYWTNVFQDRSPNSFALQEEAYDEIRNTFKPNLTLYVSDLTALLYIWTLLNDSKCSIKDDPYTAINSIENAEMVNDFNKRMNLYNDQTVVTKDSPCYSILSVFFDAIIASLSTLQGRIKIEVLQGDYITELIKMQDGDDPERPQGFPRTYTRMWLSNIPDYVGGPFAISLYTLPSLETTESTSVAGNCLMNTGIWQPGGEQYVFHHTHLSCKDYDRFLGGRIITMKPDFGVTEYAHGLQSFPLPLCRLPSRAETHSWLTRVLLGLLAPCKAGTNMGRVHNPHTLTMFVKLLIHMHTVGYPSHWLSDYLHLVLHDEIVTDVVTYTGAPPAPLDFMGRTGQRRKVNLQPYQAEFETILALSYEAIPFHVPFPDDFAQHHTEIATFEAPSPVLGRMTMSKMYGYDPVFYLIFFKNGTQSRLPSSIIDILQGQRVNQGDIHILSIIDDFGIGIGKVRWRMARSRVRSMQQEGWKLLAYRHDINEYSFSLVSSTQWKEVEN